MSFLRENVEQKTNLRANSHMSSKNLLKYSVVAQREQRIFGQTLIDHREIHGHCKLGTWREWQYGLQAIAPNEVIVAFYIRHNGR